MLLNCSGMFLRFLSFLQCIVSEVRASPSNPFVQVCLKFRQKRSCFEVPSRGCDLERIVSIVAKEFPDLRGLFGIREGSAVLPLQWLVHKPQVFAGQDLELVEDTWESVAPEVLSLSVFWAAASKKQRTALASKFFQQVIARGAVLVEVPEAWGIAAEKVLELSTKIFQSTLQQKQAAVYRDRKSGYFHGWEKISDGSRREHIQVRVRSENGKIQFPDGTATSEFDDAAFELFQLYRNVSLSAFDMLMANLDRMQADAFEHIFGHSRGRLGRGSLSDDYFRVIQYHSAPGECPMHPHADVGMMAVSPLVAAAGLEALQPTRATSDRTRLAKPVRQWEWQRMEGHTRSTVWIVYVGEVAARLFGAGKTTDRNQSSFLWPLFHRVCFPGNVTAGRRSIPFFQRLHGDTLLGALAGQRGEMVPMRQFFQQLKRRSYNTFSFDASAPASESAWSSALGPDSDRAYTACGADDEDAESCFATQGRADVEGG